MDKLDQAQQRPAFLLVPTLSSVNATYKDYSLAWSIPIHFGKCSISIIILITIHLLVNA